MATEVTPEEALRAAAARCLDGCCFNSLAPMLIGAIVSCVLLGIILTQCCTFFCLYPQRTCRWMRLLGGSMMALQVAQTAMDSSRIIKVLAVHYGDLAYWLTPRFEDAAAPFLGTFIQAIAQGYLFSRAWKLTILEHKKVKRPVKYAVGAAFILLIVIAAVSNMVGSVAVKTMGTLLKLKPGAEDATLYSVPAMTTLLTSALVDLGLGAILSHELLSGQRDIESDPRSSRGTHQMVHRLLVLTVESGALLATIQLATAITWLIEAYALDPNVHKGSWVYLGVLVVSKIYSLTFFQWLNTPRAAASSRTFDDLVAAAGSSGQHLQSSVPMTEKSSTLTDFTITSEEMYRLAISASPTRPGVLAFQQQQRPLTRSGGPQVRYHKPTLSSNGRPSLQTIAERRSPTSSQSGSQESMHEAAGPSFGRESRLSIRAPLPPTLDMDHASASHDSHSSDGDPYRNLASYRFGDPSQHPSQKSFISMLTTPSSRSAASGSRASSLSEQDEDPRISSEATSIHITEPDHDDHDDRDDSEERRKGSTATHSTDGTDGTFGCTDANTESLIWALENVIPSESPTRVRSLHSSS